MIGRLRETLARLEREHPVAYFVVLMASADACVFVALTLAGIGQ